MSGDEEGEKRRKKKYNSFIRPSLSKYAGEWKQTYGMEKDLVNLHQLYDVEGRYQPTACPTVPDIKSNTELLKIQSQDLYETPENVKSKDKDSEVECVTGCIDACCVVTGHGVKNCQETVFEVGTSKSENNEHYHHPTREEKLEALWIKENGNVMRDREHSSPSLPLLYHLTNTLRQALLLCSVSEKTCQRPLLHVNNESELAVIIMEGIKELAFKDDHAIEKFRHILKKSLAICNEVVEEGEDGEESSDAIPFLKVLLDMITCMGSHRNNKMDELNFDRGKIRNNLRNRRPVLLDDNVIHKRYNIQILDKIINFEDEEKKGSESLTALQLKVKEERVSVGILSAMVIKEDATLLLKEMKMFSSQLYKTKAATTASEEKEGRKKKMKLSRVTREIRARMKRRTELKRQEWGKEELSDEN